MAYVRWERVAMDVGTGAVGGAVSKLVENWDADRESKLPAGSAPLSFFNRASNYADYGVGLLGLLGTFFGFLSGDWETRVLTLGGTLAGRRATGELTKKPTTTAAWQRYGNPQAAALAQRQAVAAEAARQAALAAGGGGARTSAWRPQTVRAGG